MAALAMRQYYYIALLSTELIRGWRHGGSFQFGFVGLVLSLVDAHATGSQRLYDLECGTAQSTKTTSINHQLELENEYEGQCFSNRWLPFPCAAFGSMPAALHAPNGAFISPTASVTSGDRSAQSPQSDHPALAPPTPKHERVLPWKCTYSWTDAPELGAR
ncbi:hypothetical protein FA95DRAFT_1573608 [Auriscalpium vulgare]|uniref:Uncharacterized protein n=1 Tax=Auriscalpium vulgare TaxID=40419 RepID=A0ACB8RNC2_9AGAM|nr:hypothetical protein FA95DRAFT_1573608 [Auriscalpium vulgare]